jgi:hypothetical protein
MARAGPGRASVSTVRLVCRASDSVAVTAVTSYASSTPSFFGHTAECEAAHISIDGSG